MNKTFFVVALLVEVGLSSITGAAYALNETERYNSGYNHGYMDAKNGAASYCSTSDHTYTYCQGYNAGYQAVHVQTQQIPSSPSLPYSIGFAAGKRDALKNVYDSSACQPIADNSTTGNWTSDQVYTCLKGYYDGTASPYRAGYLQGVQGIELKGTHTPAFIKGYFKGIQGYWYNRGLVEGYSGLPMSLHNKNYTDTYKSEAAERAAGYPCTKKAGSDLGTLPTHTNDNYRDFYLGLDQGGDAYNLVGSTRAGPPGHTVEYYAGWKFGYGLGLAADSDCS